jgi:hypothetical protein
MWCSTARCSMTTSQGLPTPSTAPPSTTTQGEGEQKVPRAVDASLPTLDLGAPGPPNEPDDHDASEHPGHDPGGGLCGRVSGVHPNDKRE